MGALRRNRLLAERALPQDAPARRGGRAVKAVPARSVTVNLAESPLGWLKARGHVSARQYDAGDRLREDWERAQLGPNVTMAWNAAPADRDLRAAPRAEHRSPAALAARRRFDAAVKAVGPGLADVMWRTVCAGEGMRDVEQTLGWPARAGKLVLGLALDRLAEHYRLP